MPWRLPGGSTLQIVRGDLTRVADDAIVNAANPMMLGGGGVDGAIHAAAGPRLLEACRRVKAVDGIRCPPGEARLTPAFELPAQWVVHTVGPVYRRDPDPPGTLASAHRRSVEVAREAGARSIAFPAISCGAYGYPHDEAAAVALEAVADAEGLDTIRFVHFGTATHDAWVAAADARFPRAG